MASQYKLSDEDKELLREYGTDNWPPILNKHEIELYFKRQWVTIMDTYGKRPDWPVSKVAGIWQVQFMDLQGFTSAYFMGRLYEGLKNVQYGGQYTDD